MVVTLKGHDWPTFKASGPELLTVTKISSGVLCHVQPSAKKGDWTLRTDSTEKGTSTEVAAQELLVLENPQMLMRVILGRVDSHGWRAAVRKSASSCVILVPTSPV